MNEHRAVSWISRRTVRSAGVVCAAVVATSLGITVPSAGAARSHARKQHSGNSKITIDFVSGPLSDNFFPPLKNGADQAAAQLGVKLNYIADNEADFATTSVDNMQVAIAQHPDAIVVSDFVSSASDPLIKKAVAKGIPVYISQSGQFSWKKDGALGFVGNQGPASGQVAAERLVKDHAKNILCVINVADNPYLESVCTGLHAEIKHLGGTSANLDLPTADSTDPTKVTADIGAYLRSHPKVTGVFSENAEVGTSALAAVRSLNKVGKIKVGTLELSKLALNDVKNGSIAFLISEQPYLEGYYGVLVAYQYVKYGLLPVGTINTGPMVIDKSNIKKVLAVASKYSNVVGSA